MVVVIFAHPYPDRSVANRTLLAGLDGLDGVEVRSLYDRYPDFAIRSRSATLPAHGESTSTGMNWPKLRTPSRNAECVRR